MNNHSISQAGLAAPQVLRSGEHHLLQERMGHAIARALSERADAPGHDITERLRVAREQALARAQAARAAQAAPAAASAAIKSGSAAVLAGGPAGDDNTPLWGKLAMLVPLLLLLLGMAGIEWNQQEREAAALQAVADIDSDLLSDELPPSAYTDPGFAEFLETRVQ